MERRRQKQLQKQKQKQQQQEEQRQREEEEATRQKLELLQNEKTENHISPTSETNLNVNGHDGHNDLDHMVVQSVDQEVVNDIDRLLLMAKRVGSPTIHSPLSTTSTNGGDADGGENSRSSTMFSHHDIKQYLEESGQDHGHMMATTMMTEEERHALHVKQVRSHYIEQEMLRELSGYLNARVNLSEKGRARVFRICPAYYAIGTSHGIILLFGRQDRKVSQLRIGMCVCVCVYGVMLVLLSVVASI